MKKAASILFALLFCLNGYSQDLGFADDIQTEQRSEQVEIYFGLNSYAVNPKYNGNRATLDHLSELIDKLRRDPQVEITDIVIDSYASPEAGYHYNQRLTERRTNSLYDYLIQTIAVPDSIITKTHSGIDWAGLKAAVESSDMPYRDEVLDIIENTPEETWRKVNPTDKWMSLVDSRNKHLMDLRGGRPYNYMVAHFFSQLRAGSIVTVYFKSTPVPFMSEAVEIQPTNDVKYTPIAPIGKRYSSPLYSPVTVSDESTIKFALKSNLLYDVLLTPNIEVEVPIGNRWSVAGEWICPWWVTRNNGYALEILSGQVEGRYWFGDRTNKPQLTGWFGGLYAGGGLYDLQWKNNGYQGEFYIAAGASAGYAHTINKRGNLRLEYTLGLGYLSTKYRYYEGMQDNEYLVWQHNGNYTWLGPTKAEVSLVWFINWKRGGKR